MSWSVVTRDARHALRMLLHSPGFSLVAAATFALGIGVNTAVFSVINGLLLRPLPYPDADRITLIWMDNRRQGIREDITSYPNYRDWRDQSASYEHMSAFTPASFNLSGAGDPERLPGALVTANFFDVMGVRPVLGRLFTTAHETPGNETVIVISYGFWQRKFGGASDVLGRTITLNGRPHEVIGVMPPELQYPRDAELWRPLAVDQDARESRGSFWLPVIGRLKPGVRVEAAQTEMTAITARLEEAYPSNRGFGAYVVPLHQQIVGDIERPLFVLMGAVGFVLLISCANLANLMFSRTSARRKELAIRTALGAGRGRLVRQIVTETFVLALLGGALGVALAYAATQFFINLGGQVLPRPDAIAIDGWVLSFTVVVVAVASLLAGLIPALQASRPGVVDQLREGGRQTSAFTSRRTRNVLVGAEVALAFMLLFGAGLLTRTLLNMQSVDRGFEAEGIAKLRLSLPAVTYPNPVAVRGFYERLLDRVRTIPGVESAATGTAVLQPLVTNSGVFSIEGKPLPPPEERPEYPVESVSPGFFETLGIPLRSGRTFTLQDHADATPVIVINETLARQGWPDQDPIGRRMRAGGENSTAPWLTVIGVIRDVHRADVKREIRPELYRCTLQATPRSQLLLVRTAGDPSALVSTIRREVQSLDPQLPLYSVGTLKRDLSATLEQQRFQAFLLVGFAGIALLLAAVGIYGVTSNAVGQRTQELGVRMALGAKRLDVLSLILLQHVRPALIGVAAGLAGALVVSRFLGSLLYGVGTMDPFTFGLVAIALFVVSVAACSLPAMRATRVDPIVAMRID